MTEQVPREELLALTSEIVASYVGNNSLSAHDIPDVINLVYRSLSRVGEDVSPFADRPKPAVPIKKSVMPDYIVCLEDGKQMKMLKRHLRTAYDMSPDQYRERWGLPADYPMVAPNYAKKRSSLAKDIGLGKR